MQKQFEIGSVLHFDKVKYDSTINFWKTYLIPGIKKIWDEYSQLSLGVFTPDILILAVDGFHVFEKQYIAFLENGIKHSNPFMGLFYSRDQIMENGAVRLTGMKAAVSSLNRSILQLSTVMLPISLQHCSITGDSVTINEEAIRAECTLDIQTEDQLEVWNTWTKVVNDFNSAVDLLVSKGFDPGTSNILGHRGFISESNDCRLTLDPECILHVPSVQDLQIKEQLDILMSRPQLKQEDSATEEQVQTGQKVDYDLQSFKSLSAF